jgi:hypothetical protein
VTVLTGLAGGISRRIEGANSQPDPHELPRALRSSGVAERDGRQWSRRQITTVRRNCSGEQALSLRIDIITSDTDRSPVTVMAEWRQFPGDWPQMKAMLWCTDRLFRAVKIRETFESSRFR